MKARTTALASLVLGGAVGYCQKPIVEPPRPPNPQIMRIAEDLRKRGFREEFEHNSWWLNWHRQYMYSRTISAQAQASFVDPETGVTEKYYSIIPELQNHLIWVLPTVLDEGLGNVAFRTLPNHVGVTGTLEIGPFKSTEVGGTPTEEKILVLKASVPEGSGRKSICSGELSWYGSNDVLTTGKVIMIEQWWGKYLAFLI